MHALREPPVLSAAEKRALIRQAYNYNSHARNMASCNHLYMGSMATCLLFGDLGADWPNVSLSDALKGASDEQLDAGLARCANILKYVKRKEV